MSDFATYPQLAFVALAAVLGAILCGKLSQHVVRESQGRLRGAGWTCRLASILMGGLSCAAVACTYGPTLESVELGLFCCVLLHLTLTDLDAFVIPNACIVAALAIRAGYLGVSLLVGSIGWPEVVRSVAALLVIGGILLASMLVLERFWGAESMGGGDLKLFSVAGFYYGWRQTMVLIVISCVLGLFSSIILRPGGRNAGDDDGDRHSGEGRQSTAFPFGPSIAVACLVTALCGSLWDGWLGW